MIECIYRYILSATHADTMTQKEADETTERSKDTRGPMKEKKKKNTEPERKKVDASAELADPSSRRRRMFHSLG